MRFLTISLDKHAMAYSEKKTQRRFQQEERN
jgi:hypothetical protein